MAYQHALLDFNRGHSMHRNLLPDIGLELQIGDIIIHSAAAATSSSASAASASAAPAEAAAALTPGSAAAALNLAYMRVSITWQRCIPWSRTYRHALPDFNRGHGVIA